MAAWIPKIVQATRNQNACTISFAVQNRDYCTNPRIIKNPTTASLKRGTGGRSSFNGIVCTVFGCNGFIGNKLCIRLGRIGTQLILPHRCDDYMVKELKVGGDLGQVLYRPFDLRDEEGIIKSIKYSNVVVNLVGANYETNNFSYHDVHVDGARRLARLAKECNVERFIHMSCLNVSENPEAAILKNGSQVLRAKWEGEQAVKEEFPEATIIRPAAIYGSGDKFVTHYLNTNRHAWKITLPLWKRGEKTEKQPVHISDVISGIVAIIKNPDTAGKTYQFFGPERYKLRRLVERMYELTLEGGDNDVMRIVDLRFQPSAWLKATIFGQLQTVFAISDMTWEVLEQHHVSDMINPNLPTLEDLGIKADRIENHLHWIVLPMHQYKHIVSDMQKKPPVEVKTGVN